MRTTLTCAATLLALSAFGIAYAATDAAYDDNNKVVVDSNGKCVHTKWEGDRGCEHKVVKTVTQTVVTPPPPSIHDVTEEQRTVYFDFNSATLTAAGKAKLDTLAAAINRSSEVKAVTIHGYTDQLGTNAYNDKLATRRAEVVKAYLDSKSKLQSNVGDVRGIGKSDPTAGCASMKKRASKISCMASERRVEAELTLDE